MNRIEDQDILDAEREASRERFEHVPTAHTTLEPVETPTRSLTPEQSTQSRPLHPTQSRPLHPVELERLHTHRSIHSGTVGRRANSRTSGTVEKLKTLGGGKIFAPADYNVEEFLVEFDGHDDPLHPQNWSMRKR